MIKIEPRIKTILVFVFMVGIIKLDKVLDVIIFSSLVLVIFLLSPKRFAPFLLPIPVTLAIIVMNLIIIRDTQIFRALRFYYATTIALQYAMISTSEDIISGIGGILRWLGIGGGEIIYSGVAAAKGLSLKGTTLHNFPQKIAELIKKDIPINSIEVKSYPIRKLDIVLLLITIGITIVVFIL